MMMFQDLNPLGGGVGTIAAVVFFLIFAAVAYISFRLLKRTVKMAVRLAIVGVILAVALAGSIALWYTGAVRSTPTPTRPSRPANLR
jgi:hypothetical protein